MGTSCKRGAPNSDTLANSGDTCLVQRHYGSLEDSIRAALRKSHQKTLLPFYLLYRKPYMQRSKAQVRGGFRV